MTLRIPSSSALPLVHQCQASWAIPHGGRSASSRSKLGDALHQHMEDRARLGVTEAMFRLEVIARAHRMTETETSIFMARARHFEWSPPRGSFGEVALCLLEDGQVVRMTGGKGEYDWPEGAVTGGTLDLMWSSPEPLDMSDPEHPRCPEGSVLWVPDTKTGDETWVEPVEINWQVLTNAVLAAKWTGAKSVVPAVIFWRKGQGEWDVPMKDELTQPWGQARMAQHERELRELRDRWVEQQRRAATGEPLSMNEGPGCTYCPARSRCSLHTATLKMVASGQMANVGDAPITREERVWFAERISTFENFAQQLREVLRADVDANGPIVLSNGNIWGPHPKPRTTILVDKAAPVLEEELGDERVATLVSRSISMDAIKQSVKEMHQEQGIERKGASTVRRILGKLGTAGALVTEDRVVYGPHKLKTTIAEDADDGDDA